MTIRVYTKKEYPFKTTKANGHGAASTGLIMIKCDWCFLTQEKRKLESLARKAADEEASRSHMADQGSAMDLDSIRNNAIENFNIYVEILDKMNQRRLLMNRQEQDEEASRSNPAAQGSMKSLYQSEIYARQESNMQLALRQQNENSQLLLRQENEISQLLLRQGQDEEAARSNLAAQGSMMSPHPSESPLRQDYLMQLALLEQQNKARLKMAQQEQDNVSGSRSANQSASTSEPRKQTI